MLFKCQECLKMVSSKAKYCVHCGFPYGNILDERNNNPMICYYKDEIHDLTDAFNSILKKKEEYMGQNYLYFGPEEKSELARVGNVPVKLAGFIYENEAVPAFFFLDSERNQAGQNIKQVLSDDSKKIDKVIEKTEQITRNRRYKPEEHTSQSSTFSQPSPGTVTCPFCRSTDVKKIGVVSRATGAYVAGIASKKIGKQWHCNKCGSDF